MARTPIHPGEILAQELQEIGLSAESLADLIEAPPNTLYQILAGKRNLTADTALRLAQYFGMSADFWMNLRSAYDLDLAREQSGKAIQRIPRRAESEPRPAVQGLCGIGQDQQSPYPRFVRNCNGQQTL